MSKIDKLIEKLLLGNADNNFTIEDLKTILLFLGFDEKKGKGSHTLFKHNKVAELVNIQKIANGKAKGYQVKHIRNYIFKFKLF